MKQKIVNAIAYIIWTLSVFVLSYYAINKSDIDVFYQIAGWFMIMSCIVLYKKDYSELTLELFKVILIATGNTVLSILMGNTQVDIYGVFKLTGSTVGSALICYVIIWYTKNTYKLHGETGYRLEYITWTIFAILAFCFKISIVISLLFSVSFNFCVGFLIWYKNENEKIIQKQEAARLEQEKSLAQKQRRAKRKRNHKKGQTGQK